jgi:AraC-like DNA-binding protein
LAFQRILLIDDDPSVIESLSSALAPPYAVSGAWNGAVALASLEREGADLILLDLVLGAEDGVDLIPSLRTRTPAPILLITGYGTRENLVRAIRARPDDFLEKPVSVPELRSRVAALLAPSPAEADPLDRVRAWIASECHRPLMITDLARAAGMSPAHFYRTFAKRFGLTPRAYLVQCRMRWAATQLRDGDDLIKELAPEVGFTRPNNFSRAFKRIYGCTPEAFRNEGHPVHSKKTE